MDDGSEARQVTVSPSAVAKDQASDLVRNMVLAISVITTLVGFVSKHDLASFILYVKSSEFLSFMTLLITAGTIAWSQWKTRHRAKQIVSVAGNPRVPADIATLTTPGA